MLILILRRSTAVVRLSVKQDVVGSIPTFAAILRLRLAAGLWDLAPVTEVRILEA